MFSEICDSGRVILSVFLLLCMTTSNIFYLDTLLCLASFCISSKIKVVIAGGCVVVYSIVDGICAYEITEFLT